MSDSISGAEAAERRLFPKRDAHEKGSAMSLIKADAEATALKTARLRALRLAADVAPAAPEKKAKPAATRTRTRNAASRGTA